MRLTSKSPEAFEVGRGIDILVRLVPINILELA